MPWTESSYEDDWAGMFGGQLTNDGSEGITIEDKDKGIGDIGQQKDEQKKAAAQMARMFVSALVGGAGASSATGAAGTGTALTNTYNASNAIAPSMGSQIAGSMNPLTSLSGFGKDVAGAFKTDPTANAQAFGAVPNAAGGLSTVPTTSTNKFKLGDYVNPFGSYKVDPSNPTNPVRDQRFFLTRLTDALQGHNPVGDLNAKFALSKMLQGQQDQSAMSRELINQLGQSSRNTEDIQHRERLPDISAKANITQAVEIKKQIDAMDDAQAIATANAMGANVSDPGVAKLFLKKEADKQEATAAHAKTQATTIGATGADIDNKTKRSFTKRVLAENKQSRDFAENYTGADRAEAQRDADFSKGLTAIPGNSAGVMGRRVGANVTASQEAREGIIAGPDGKPTWGNIPGIPGNVSPFPTVGGMRQNKADPSRLQPQATGAGRGFFDSGLSATPRSVTPGIRYDLEERPARPAAPVQQTAPLNPTPITVTPAGPSAIELEILRKYLPDLIRRGGRGYQGPTTR